MAEDSKCKTSNFEELESQLVGGSGNNTAIIGQDVSLVTKKQNKKTNKQQHQYFLLLLAPNLLGPGEMTHSELLGTASVLNFFIFFNLFFSARRTVCLVT